LQIFSIKDIILKDLRGYIKKSFGVITNPNYSVDPNSKILTDDVGFVKKIINSDRDLISQSINRFSNLTKDQARTEYAKELVLNILRTGKINSNNPMKALEEIGKQIKFDKIIKIKSGINPKTTFMPKLNSIYQNFCTTSRTSI
jgi:hypothetical protein